MAIRSVVKMSRGTLMISIPVKARKLMDIEPGDKVDVSWNDATKLLEVRKLKIEPA